MSPRDRRGGGGQEPAIDLHEHRSPEARRRLREGLDALRRVSPGVRVRIITGRGLGSDGGPVLAPMVEGMLRNGSLPDVVAWEKAADGGSFIVQLAGNPSGRREQPDRLHGDAKAESNRRRLEYAARKARRAAESERDEREEQRRLQRLKQEHGGKELPDWLCTPPEVLVRARIRRAAEQAADDRAFGDVLTRNGKRP